MPCNKCENDKWRWGESGECQYDTLAECETANADYDLEESNKKRRYYGDDEHDYHFSFTKEMMKTLHDEGELEVVVEQDGNEMKILFTFDNEERKEEIVIDKDEDKVISSMLDEELDVYINKLTDSIKQL